MTLPTDLPVLAFADQAALEAWLEAEHLTAPGLYVKIAKKGSGVPSVNWEQMVEVLLCFGWIDGRANRLDDHFYLQRITPRRAKSVWSLKNVATVERLIAEGRMRPAGLAVVEAARADGRWERAYAGPKDMTVPDDLAAALDAEPVGAGGVRVTGRREPLRDPLAGAHRGDPGDAGETDRGRRRCELRSGDDDGPPAARPSRRAARGGVSRRRCGWRSGSRPGGRWSRRPAVRRCGRAPSSRCRCTGRRG